MKDIVSHRFNQKMFLYHRKKKILFLLDRSSTFIFTLIKKGEKKKAVIEKLQQNFDITKKSALQRYKKALRELSWFDILSF